MANMDWAAFLRQWSRDMLSSPLGDDVPVSARTVEWLGFPPATETQIAVTEDRLQIALPPSFKAFLHISNGWLRTTHAIAKIRGLDEIGWFRKRERKWISAFTKPYSFEPREKTPDQDYFAYGDHAEDFRIEHLKETLQISDVGDSAVYLLNPQVITRDGEWEAWFFATWLPGVHRYRSFEEMMLAEYQQFSGGDRKQPVGVVGELPDEYAGSPGSEKRKIKKRLPPRVRKILGKPYHRWTVDELLDMLRNPDFNIIHDEVIRGLALLGDRRAVDPLVALLDDETATSISAMHALKKLAPEILPDQLFALLSKPIGGKLYAAGGLMAEMGDNRAITPLLTVMRDTTPRAHEAEYIAEIIARFGMKGYDALVSCLGDPNPIIRRRAADGISYTRRPEGRAAVEPLLNDPDATVRKAASMTFDLLPRECKSL